MAVFKCQMFVFFQIGVIGHICQSWGRKGGSRADEREKKRGSQGDGRGEGEFWLIHLCPESERCSYPNSGCHYNMHDMKSTSSGVLSGVLNIAFMESYIIGSHYDDCGLL